MKKNYYPLCLTICVFLFSIQKSAGQNGSVGIGNTTPDPSSILDIRSTNKGVLLPRMTLSQRNGINFPVTGLLIYQTDGVPGFYYYFNGWQPLSSSSDAATRALSNLATTAINTDLLPANTAVTNLGSPGFQWRDIYLSGDLFLQGNRFLTLRGSNNFFGNTAGNAAVTGLFNTASGGFALTNNISGYWNTANGYQSLYATNAGSSNTGIGFQALTSNTTGSYNTATGVTALSNSISGNGNTAAGLSALNSMTSGNNNTAVGITAGFRLPSGDNNTFIGSSADVASGVSVSNSTAIGNEAIVTASNSVRLGNSSVTSIGGAVNWSTVSDGRFKKNVRENVPGLAFINQLRPVTYNIDVKSIDRMLQVQNASGMETKSSKPAIKPSAAEQLSKQAKASIEYTGFIAQEVEQSAKKIGYQFSGVDAPKNDADFYGLRYGEFVVPLVKAVQELNGKTESLEKKFDLKGQKDMERQSIILRQQKQIDDQQQQIESLKAMVLAMQKEISSMKSSTTN